MEARRSKNLAAELATATEQIESLKGKRDKLLAELNELKPSEETESEEDVDAG